MKNSVAVPILAVIGSATIILIINKFLPLYGVVPVVAGLAVGGMGCFGMFTGRYFRETYAFTLLFLILIPAAIILNLILLTKSCFVGFGLTGIFYLVFYIKRKIRRILVRLSL